MPSKSASLVRKWLDVEPTGSPACASTARWVTARTPRSPSSEIAASSNCSRRSAVQPDYNCSEVYDKCSYPRGPLPSMNGPRSVHGPSTMKGPGPRHRDQGPSSSVSTRVGKGGVEPPRPFGHTDLN